MIDKIDKTSGLNSPETYMLTHNRFNTYMVLMFSDLNKAQIYKMLCKISSHDKIEILMNFKFLNVFKTNEYTEYYHVRKPNDENFLLEIEDKKLIYVGEKVNTFETNEIIVNYSSELGFNDFKFPYAYGENTNYFILHRKKSYSRI